MENQTKDSPENIVEELSKLLGRLNWSIAVPDVNAVDHLIIGKKEKIEDIVSNLAEEYDIMVRETN